MQLIAWDQCLWVEPAAACMPVGRLRAPSWAHQQCCTCVTGEVVTRRSAQRKRGLGCCVAQDGPRTRCTGWT